LIKAVSFEGSVMSEISTANGAGRYEIRLKGHLESRWASWFDGLALTKESDGSTVIRGIVADQSALHGLLQKVRDLGVPLLSVTRIESEEAASVPPTEQLSPTQPR
jgi:hypothetical protein